jgi:hypothetical protein
MAALVDPNAVSALLKKTGPPRTDQELREAYDEDVRLYRELRDQMQPMNANDIAAHVNASFNDARQDAATGPVGYNRQWVPLLQSLKGKRFVGGGSLPTEKYADPTHSGTRTLQPSAARDVTTPRTTMTPTAATPRVTMRPDAPVAPDPTALDPNADLDAFQKQWAQGYDATHPTTTPAATTPTTTLKQRATKTRGVPVGRVPPPDAITASPSPPGSTFSLDALQQRANAPVTASPSPPGDRFIAPPPDPDAFFARRRTLPPWYGGDA